jgi:hypothetical protein
VVVTHGGGGGERGQACWEEYEPGVPQGRRMVIGAASLGVGEPRMGILGKTETQVRTVRKQNRNLKKRTVPVNECRVVPNASGGRSLNSTDSSLAGQPDNKTCIYHNVSATNFKQYIKKITMPSSRNLRNL